MKTLHGMEMSNGAFHEAVLHRHVVGVDVELLHARRTGRPG